MYFLYYFLFKIYSYYQNLLEKYEFMGKKLIVKFYIKKIILHLT